MPLLPLWRRNHQKRINWKRGGCVSTSFVRAVNGAPMRSWCRPTEVTSVIYQHCSFFHSLAIINNRLLSSGLTQVWNQIWPQRSFMVHQLLKEWQHLSYAGLSNLSSRTLVFCFVLFFSLLCSFSFQIISPLFPFINCNLASLPLSQCYSWGCGSSEAMLQRLLHRHPQATRQDCRLHLRPVLSDQWEAREENRWGLERHDWRGKSLFMCLWFCLSAWVRNVFSASNTCVCVRRVRVCGCASTVSLVKVQKIPQQSLWVISITVKVSATYQLLTIRQLSFVTHTWRHADVLTQTIKMQRCSVLLLEPHPHSVLCKDTCFLTQAHSHNVRHPPG